MDLKTLIPQYAAVQDALLTVMHGLYPAIEANENPQMWPQVGTVHADGQSWTFVRHGYGYTFTAEGGQVVEAHDRIRARPYPFDAYRLREYILSLSVVGERTRDGGRDVPSVADIASSLVALCEDGVVVRDTRWSTDHPTVSPYLWNSPP